MRSMARGSSPGPRGGVHGRPGARARAHGTVRPTREQTSRERYEIAPAYVAQECVRVRRQYRQSTLTDARVGFFGGKNLNLSDYDAYLDIDVLVTIEAVEPKGDAQVFSAKFDRFRFHMPNPLESTDARARISEGKRQGEERDAHPLEGDTVKFDRSGPKTRIFKVLKNGEDAGITTRFPELLPIMQALVDPDWVPVEPRPVRRRVGDARRHGLPPDQGAAALALGDARCKLISVANDVAVIEVRTVLGEEFRRVKMEIQGKGLITVDLKQHRPRRWVQRGGPDLLEDLEPSEARAARRPRPCGRRSAPACRLRRRGDAGKSLPPPAASTASTGIVSPTGTTILEPASDTTTALSPPWRVILHDDPVTTQEFVVWLLITLFGHPFDKANRRMLEVHDAGASAVATCSQERAEAARRAGGSSLSRPRRFPAHRRRRARAVGKGHGGRTPSQHAALGLKEPAARGIRAAESSRNEPRRGPRSGGATHEPGEGLRRASATSPLAPATIPRRDPTDRDVQIEILFCGVCHSDLHPVAQRVERASCPRSTRCVPGPRDRRPRHARSAGGHEVQGRATSSAVGCMVDSYRTCPQLQGGPRAVLPERDASPTTRRTSTRGGITYGGYSESIVVDEHFVLRIPPNLDLAGAAPLLCAGITTYSPLRHWGVGKGKKVGIVGLGGLGHMGVKFAHAFGAHVVRLHHLAEQEGGRASASAPTRSSSPRTPTRCRSTPAASTSSSTPSPPTTTSTPTSTCSGATAT